MMHRAHLTLSLFLMTLLAGCPQETATHGDFDGDGVVDDEDCDPEDEEIYPGADDPYGDGIDQNCDGADGVDQDGDGYAYNAPGDSGQQDCDDEDDTSYPGAEETCDGVDNDCDGVVDDGVGEDADSDGHTGCDGDCDDQDPDTYPGATEQCDGVDNDCDGALPADEEDGDGDGVMACAGDCDDADDSVYPGANDPCGDGVDSDCGGDLDQELDGDGDGAAPCEGDCDDTDADLNIADDDGDGVDTCAGDCDDGDATIYPGAKEVCDGVDQDCDGTPDDGTSCFDDDGDGVTEDDGDCDDANDEVYPGADEICDGLDTDCDGTTPAAEGIDADADGWPSCADCDDGDAALGEALLVPGVYPTIQDAIDAAGYFDLICVAPGTYTETIDYGGKDLHLFGPAGAAQTVIDGGGSGPVVSFVSGESSLATLEGFTITGGLNNYGGGGGVAIDVSAATLRDLVVTGNQAWDGGGIHIYQGKGGAGDVEMTGLVVEDNTAENPFNSSNGAGVYAYWASVVIRDTIIRNNHFDVTKGWTAGGGLYMNVGDIELEDVQIEDNVGEVYIDGESVELTRVEIRGSDCSDYGAGTPQLSISCEDLEIADSVIENSTTCAGLTMWCDTMCTVRNSVIQYNEGGSGIAMECPFNVSNTAIIGNVAENGGGIHYSCNYMLTEPMSLSNLLIAQNHATYAGGGIYCWGNSSLAEITNVVIAENTAGQFGGGVRESAGSSTTEFTNCVVVGNSAGTDGGGFYAEKPPNSIHVSTDTWDNQPGNFSQYYPDPTGSDGNLSEDPQFLDRSDPDPMQWDLHLALGSPLIDGGGGSGSDPDFGTPDIGIYGGWNAEAWDLDFDGYDDWWMPGPYDFKTYPGLGWDCDDRDPDVYPGNGC